jgi:hypothetical protein
LTGTAIYFYVATIGIEKILDWVTFTMTTFATYGAQIHLMLYEKIYSMDTGIVFRHAKTVV